MKVLVSGGAGFLGSHVADELTASGHAVTVFDAKRSPYLRKGQRQITGSITDPATVRRAVRGHRVVYHFAGMMDIEECIRKPVETVTSNILGTVILLEACRAEKIKRFVFASSTYVYSNSGAHYRTSKQACELFIEDYHRLHNLSYTILRYGSLYGNRAGEHNSIYKLLKGALDRGLITYHGSGEEMREFIHVRDAAQLSVRILEKEFENQHITLTGHQAMKYRDLLLMIRELLGKKVRIRYLPRTSDAHYEMTSYSFNPRIGKKLINNPHIDLGQGLIACLSELYERRTSGCLPPPRRTRTRSSGKRIS